MVWAPGGKAGLGLFFQSPLPVVKTKTGKAEGAPEEGLATSREEAEEPGPGGGQKLRMGVCFGTRANRIADGWSVWEAGKACSHEARGRCLHTWVHREDSPLHPGPGGGAAGEK